MEKKIVKSVQDLNVYLLSYKLALEVFQISKQFPREEIYSLTDQIRRSSRSVPANISEGFAKRQYSNIFKNHLISALGSGEETITWVDFARDSGYVSNDDSKRIIEKYKEVGAMLYSMINNWKTR